MKYLFLIFVSFNSFIFANTSIKAAEKITINFEEMKIPLNIDQLSKLETYENDSTEVSGLINQNGLFKLYEFSKFLYYPIFKKEGLNRQILRSWVGSKILTELSNTIIIPNDNNGVELFNTIETLLESKREVSTLEIIKALPSNEISLDIDNLIKIISSWKEELISQQNLILKLNSLQKTNNNFSREKTINDYIYNYPEVVKINKKIFTSHRASPLKIEIWKNKNFSKKEVIIFMTGLGGNINNFQWLGIELSKRGWPIIFIDHEGSNSESLAKVIKGFEVFPSGADLFLYRLKDLDVVINALNDGKFELANDSYILMGHSLGAFIAFLYEGNSPKAGLENRCNLALKDFALTNLSKLIQCQVNEITLPRNNNPKKAEAIISLNTFGSLIWPYEKNSGINMPVMFIGGTYDLITPLISEQFPLFLSTSDNPLNRFLIIEGASHFSPIEINNDSFEDIEKNDLFKIEKKFIGSSPESAQNLSLKFIIKFLNNIENNEGLKKISNETEDNLDFHILDKKIIREITAN